MTIPIENPPTEKVSVAQIQAVARAIAAAHPEIPSDEVELRASSLVNRGACVMDQHGEVGVRARGVELVRQLAPGLIGEKSAPVKIDATTRVGRARQREGLYQQRLDEERAKRTMETAKRSTIAAAAKAVNERMADAIKAVTRAWRALRLAARFSGSSSRETRTPAGGLAARQFPTRGERGELVKPLHPAGSRRAARRYHASRGDRRSVFAIFCARSSALETDVQTASDRASAADATYRAALEAQATGEGAAEGLPALKKAAVTAWATHDDRKLALDLVEKKIRTVDCEHAEAIRLAGGAKERAAVEVATRRRERFRAAVVVMAEEAQGYHAACFTADAARNTATRQVGGEPVPHTGVNAARLVGLRDRDDGGVAEILQTHGIGIDWTPLRTRISPMDEAALLAARDDDDTTTEGAALSATETV